MLSPAQQASNSTDVLDSPPLSGIRTPLTVGRSGPADRPASQSCSATVSAPMLRSLTVILSFSLCDRSAADAVMAAS